MFVVEKTINIEAPLAHTWEKISKLDAVEKWLDSVTEAHYHTPIESGVGAGRTCEIEGFGTLVETATRWEEHRMITLDIQGMPAIVKTAQGTWTLEDAGGNQTRATMRIEVETRFWPVGAVMEALLLRPNFQKNVDGATAAFKRYAEA